MANISIRNLDDTVAARLRILAAEHGISMEEEIRRLLRRAVTSPTRLGDLALEIFGESYDEEIPFELPQREVSEPVSFE